MIESTVFARGAWRARHRPDPDCWCRPLLRELDGGLVSLHRDITTACVDRRQHVFISGDIKAPV